MSKHDLKESAAPASLIPEGDPMPDQQLTLDLTSEDEDQTFDAWIRSLPKTPS